MKVLVINGSPKGKYSITLQTSKFLEIKFSEHTFEYLNVGAQIRSIEKDFSQAREKITNADLLIFSYPVYTFIAPYQLHRFIELIKEDGVDLSGKFVTQISTSKHFYDVTAHRYIEDSCHDLNMKYIRGLSADMDDLSKESGQNDAVAFFNFVLWSVENGIFERKKLPDISFEPITATVPDKRTDKNNKDIVVVCDISEKDVNLKKMTERFMAVSGGQVRILNLNDINIKGGCLGCFNCAVTGECVYKDGFSETLRNNIQKADAIVYAFSVKDHSMGALFKKYDDRQFCNGHRSVTMGMPVGYLISGPYSSEDNLRMIVDGRGEVGGNFIAGVATDEFDTDKAIDEMAICLDYAIENSYCRPANFLGVGGMKIFRDLVYQMRGMMKADHKFYKEHGLYDFPQKHRVMSSAMYLVGAMLGSDKIKSKMGNKMNEGMLMPYVKVIEKAKKENKK